MKKNMINKCVLLAVAVIFLVAACKKNNDYQLSGTASKADFTYALSPSGIPDTLPFITTATFTNNSVDGFLYEWNFGDNTPTSDVADPVHTYGSPGLYTITLTSAGTNGNNVISQKIQINGAGSVPIFSKLTNGFRQEWTWGFDGDAIQVWSADSTSLYFSGPAESTCQSDDVYTFSSDGSFTYDAKGSTFVANEQPYPYSCQDVKPNATSFKLVAVPGKFPRIVLDSLVSAGRTPFIGTTDKVKENAYDILSMDSSNMVLRGRLADNSQIIIKLRKNSGLSLGDIKKLLTNNSTKSWRLDSLDNANAVVVGIESNPTLYYAGGPLAPCQKDDIYTFNFNNTLSYDAKGSTFVAGNFDCEGDWSYSNAAYPFGNVTGPVAGIAQFTLPANPKIFIGTTDASHVCRILSISSGAMVLRTGDGTGTIFTFKFVTP